MQKLVAVDLPGSSLFASVTEKCFEDEDAVLPIDQRLSKAAKENLIRLFRPHRIITAAGQKSNPSVLSGKVLPGRKTGGREPYDIKDIEVIALSDGIATDRGDALVMPTSGTTGTPKGVVLTLDALLASAEATHKYLGVVSTDDKWLCCLPPGHIGGFSVMTRGILTSTPIVAIPKFDTETVLRLLQNDNVTLTSLVSTTLRMLGDNANRFRKILLGGSRAPDETPANTVTTYGMTETASGVVYDGNLLEGVELTFRDSESSLIDPGRQLRQGEICLRGKMLFKNYRLTGEDPKQNGWFPTGDSGRLTDENRLQVDGRIQEMIITGGENVWPSHVESIISNNQNVAEVAVAGMEDGKWGQRVVAFIVPVRGTTEVDLEEIKGSIREEIGPWAVPKDVYFIDKMPKTAIGKPIKSRLLAEAAKNA